MSEQTRKRLACPECGEVLHRTHRWPLERVFSLVIPLRRYECPQCGWSGLRVSWHLPHPSFDRRFVTRAVLVLIVCLVAVGLAVWMTWRF